MKTLVLQDLEKMSEQEVINHLVENYSGERESWPTSDNQKNDLKKLLEQYEVIIAYESVGDYGCDSSSFFLLKHKENGKLFEIHGSHCSCYGFEGQLDLEETDVESLRARVENGGNIFFCGGYDNNETENQKAVKEFILNSEF